MRSVIRVTVSEPAPKRVKQFFLGLIERLEDAIYLLVAALLLVGAALVLVDAAVGTYHNVIRHADALEVCSEIRSWRNALRPGS